MGAKLSTSTIALCCSYCEEYSSFERHLLISMKNVRYLLIVECMGDKSMIKMFAFDIIIKLEGAQRVHIIMDFSRGNIRFVRDQTVLSGLT